MVGVMTDARSGAGGLGCERPAGDAHVQCSARRRLFRVPDNLPALTWFVAGSGELDHRVTPVQGLLRGERPDLRLKVHQLIRGPDHG